MSDDEFLAETLTHLDLVYNLARRSTTSIHEAEDLVQETYLRALQGWRRRRPDRTAPWLATICLNIARSQHRRRVVRPAEILDPDPGVEVASAQDTEMQTLVALDREAVNVALQQLSAEQREAVALMDLCGFTAAQVAAMIDVPRNTVLSRVHRGHKRLAELLEEMSHREA